MTDLRDLTLRLPAELMRSLDRFRTHAGPGEFLSRSEVIEAALWAFLSRSTPKTPPRPLHAASGAFCMRCDTPLAVDGALTYCLGCGWEPPHSACNPAMPPLHEGEQMMMLQPVIEGRQMELVE